MKSTIQQFFFGNSIGSNKTFNIAWLLFRLHAGLSIAIHAGFPKMNTISAPGWFVDQVAGLGFTFPSPGFWAGMAAWGEFVGGLLIAVGLLTRFAALQLAFQFFVIAFLWYDNPEPMTGMYFQHLYFWVYLLISVGGAGRFSVDHYIAHKKTIQSQLAVRSTVTACLAFLFTNVNSQTQPFVSTADFKSIEGKWTGQLNYLDYSRNKAVSISAKTKVIVESDSVVALQVAYPGEPNHNREDKYKINSAGTMINAQTLIERKETGDSLKIVLESQGLDGNDSKPATFQIIFTISPVKFGWSKWVKYTDSGEYFLRHEYIFTRE